MKYSIITINYNNQVGLRKTIESVVNQTYKDFEYIIIDGGSTDNSVEIIREYEDKIDFWISEPDGGIYNAMNKGIQKAQGDYLNFMNSGDCFHNFEVLSQVAALSVDTDIITGRRKVGDRKLDMIDRGKNGVTMRTLFVGTLGHQASFIKKEWLKKYPYDENYKIVSDWKFFIQTLIFENCSFYFTDLVIADMDWPGISNSELELSDKERKEVLSSFFSPRVLQDFEALSKLDPSFVTLLGEVATTTRFKRFLYYILKMLIGVYKLLMKIVKK